jgi:eukaryotic-like serine/threonine-protein kinase
MADLTSVLQNGDLVLDRYRVVDSIAVGGHSVVYLGHDERLARPVCIKIFSGIETESGVGRTSYEHFVQEAFALSKLTHPNTLRIFDFGHLQSDPYDNDHIHRGAPLQICEYMNGGTLSQLVRDHGPPPLAQALPIITAMCAALAEAHGLSIIHRDIKPQNILFANVGAERLAKLADFGIAKWSGETEADSAANRAEDTQIVAGRRLAMYSPSWAAPEQLAGTAASAATDIYSLAAVAVFLLTGEVIFFDEDVYAGYQKRKNAAGLVRGAFASLTKLFPERPLPGSLAEVLSTALAFDATMRHPEITDFAKALTEAAAAPLPTRSRTTTKPREPLTLNPLPPPLPEPHVSRRTQPGFAASPATALNTAPPPPVAFHSQDAVQLALVEEQVVANRRITFAKNDKGVFDLEAPGSAKLRVTLLQAQQLYVHIKGLSCFVAPTGGRPSPAIQVDQDVGFDLIAGNSKVIASGVVSLPVSSAEGDRWVYAGIAQTFSVSKEDCGNALCVDFGPGFSTYFVYTLGRPLVSISKARRT